MTSWHRLPLVAWLLLLWLLLWGTLSAAVLLSGLAVAVGVVAAFPMPRVVPLVVPRPLPLAQLALRLLADAAGSAVALAWAVVRHGDRVRSAVVEVPLRADSDLVVTMTSLLTSLTPGSMVLEIDRARLLLYVHELPASGGRVAARREKVRRAEREVVRALGYRPRDAGAAGAAGAAGEGSGA